MDISTVSRGRAPKQWAMRAPRLGCFRYYGHAAGRELNSAEPYYVAKPAAGFRLGSLRYQDGVEFEATVSGVLEQRSQLLI